MAADDDAFAQLAQLDSPVGEAMRRHLANPPLPGEFPAETAARGLDESRLAVAQVNSQTGAARVAVPPDYSPRRRSSRVSAGDFAAGLLPGGGVATPAVPVMADAAVDVPAAPAVPADDAFGRMSQPAANPQDQAQAQRDNAANLRYFKAQGGLTEVTPTGEKVPTYDAMGSLVYGPTKAQREAEAQGKRDAAATLRAQRAQGVAMATGPNGQTAPVYDDAGNVIFKPAVLSPLTRLEDGRAYRVGRDATGNQHYFDLERDGQPGQDYRVDKATGERYVTTPGPDGARQRQSIEPVPVARATPAAPGVAPAAEPDAAGVDENGALVPAAVPGAQAQAPEGNAPTIMPGHFADGLLAAHQAGTLDSEKLKTLLPKALEADKAAAEHDRLLAEDGIGSKLKAAGYGLGRGAAFLAAAPAGAGLGAEIGGGIGAFFGGAGAVPGAAIGGTLGGLIAGTAGSFAADKAIRKLGEYNATIKSFTDSADLHPVISAAGELVGFGAGIPKAASKAIGAGVDALANRAAAGSRIAEGLAADGSRIAPTAAEVSATMKAARASGAGIVDAAGEAIQPGAKDYLAKGLNAVAEGYKSGGGGLASTVSNLAQEASVRAAAGASTADIAKVIGYRVGGASLGMAAVDTAIKEGSRALGLTDEHQTLGGAAYSALLGSFMAGHGIAVPETSTPEMVSVMERVYSRIAAGVPLDAPLPREKMPASVDIARAEELARPLTPREMVKAATFEDQVRALQNQGRLPADPATAAAIAVKGATAREVLQNGQRQATAVDIRLPEGAEASRGQGAATPNAAPPERLQPLLESSAPREGSPQTSGAPAPPSPAFPAPDASFPPVVPVAPAPDAPSSVASIVPKKAAPLPSLSGAPPAGQAPTRQDERPPIDVEGDELDLTPSPKAKGATTSAPVSPDSPTALHPADALRLRGLERERDDLAAELDVPTTTPTERQARQERIAEIDAERARLAPPTAPAAPEPAPAATPAPGPVADRGAGQEAASSGEDTTVVSGQPPESPAVESPTASPQASRAADQTAPLSPAARSIQREIGRFEEREAAGQTLTTGQQSSLTTLRRLLAKETATAPASAPATTAPAPLAGEKINRAWTAFHPDSGTLNVPRSEMPQVAAEHRGALANFLSARGVDWRNEDVLPGGLKPTQAEFSPSKVERARAHEGPERRILVSSDNRIVDGHHQWLAQSQDHPNEPMGVVRLNAPARDILSQIHEFPSAGMEKPADLADASATGSPAAEKPAGPAALAVGDAVRMGRTDYTVAEVGEKKVAVIHPSTGDRLNLPLALAQKHRVNAPAPEPVSPPAPAAAEASTASPSVGAPGPAPLAVGDKAVLGRTGYTVAEVGEKNVTLTRDKDGGRVKLPTAAVERARVAPAVPSTEAAAPGETPPPPETSTAQSLAPFVRPSRATVTKQTSLVRAIEKAAAGNPKSAKLAARAATEAAKLADLRQRAAMPLQEGETPRSFSMPTAPHGAPDILDLLAEEGGMMSKAEADRRGKLEKNADLWDDAPTLKGFYHHAVYGGRQLPDVMAHGLEMNHGIGDGTVGTLHRLIAEAVQTRRTAREEAGRQATAEKQDARFQRDALTAGKGEKEVRVSNLAVGDTLTIGGEKLKVTALDPDSLDVVLEDHSKYGVQQVQDGQTLFVEKLKAAPATQGQQFDGAPPATAPAAGGKAAPADPFSLESPTGEQLDAEAEKARQRGEIADRQNKRLTAREIDSTGDLLDPSAADNPLFAGGKPTGALRDPASLTPEETATVARVSNALASDPALHDMAAALGVRGAFAADLGGVSSSGLAFRGGRLLVDPAGMKDSMEQMGRSEREWLASGLDEEAIHAATDRVPDARPRLRAIALDPEHADLHDFVGGIYQGFERLSPEQQGMEMVRAVVQGRWRGKITESVFRFIRDLLDRLREFLSKAPRNGELRRMVADVERVMQEAGAKFPEGLEPPAPAPAKPLSVRGRALLKVYDQLTGFDAAAKPLTESQHKTLATVRWNLAREGHVFGASKPGREVAPRDWPNNFPRIAPNTTGAALFAAGLKPGETLDAKGRSPAYLAAKAGDVEAAVRVVQAVAKPGRAEELAAKHPDAIIVPVHAEEASGRNKLPQVYAEWLAHQSGLEVGLGIVQSNRVFHTGADLAGRFARRATFDGPVEAGRDYILADDFVTSGGTLADLRAYIEGKGGRVVNASSLAVASSAQQGYSGDLAIRPQTRLALEEKFGDNALREFLAKHDVHGGNPGALTNVEGRWLARFGSLDAARDRIAAAGSAGGQRQRAATPGEVRPGQETGGSGEGLTGEGSPDLYAAAKPKAAQSAERLEEKTIPWLTTPDHEQNAPFPRGNAGYPLESALDDLRRDGVTDVSQRPVAERKGEVARQAARLREAAQAQGRLINPSILRRIRKGMGGNEHDVFEDRASGRMVKIGSTAVGSDGYGSTPRALKDRNGDYVAVKAATPAEYLERLALSNRVFGDDVRLHGFTERDGQTVPVTSQPFVKGREATQEEIENHLDDLGFRPVGMFDWFRDADGVSVMDAHPGNFLTDGNGKTSAIDAIVTRPTGKLRELLSTDAGDGELLAAAGKPEAVGEKPDPKALEAELFNEPEADTEPADLSGRGASAGSNPPEPAPPVTQPGVKALLARARHFLKGDPATRANKDLAAARFDSIPTRAAATARQAGNAVRLDLPDVQDQEAMPYVVEAGGRKSELLDDLAKVKAGVDAKLAAEEIPKLEHAIANFDRLDAAKVGVLKVGGKQREAEMKGGIPTREVNNYVTRLVQSPEHAAGLEAGGDFGTGGSSGVVRARYFTRGREFPKLADAVAAGFRPKTTNIADLIEHRVRSGQQLLNERAYWRELADMKARDGLPILGPVVETSSDAHGTEQKVPHGYAAVPAGDRLLTVHKDYAPLLSALYGESAIRQHAVGRGALKVAAIAKHGTVGVLDTFHLFRLGMNAATGFQETGYGKGLAALDYAPEDLDRAVEAGQITKAEADYARETSAIIQGGLEEGLLSGGGTDNLVQSAHAAGWLESIPVAGPAMAKFNSFVFGQFQRGAQAQAYAVAYRRNKARFPELSEVQVRRRSAKEINEFFGSLGSQGFFQSRTMQDAAALVGLAPRWVEGRLRTEVRGVAQGVKAAADAVQGKGFRVGNIAQAMAVSVLSALVANQLLNLFTRGKLTFQNEEEGHRLDAWIPGGAHNRGFFFSPLSLAAEYSHALKTYLEHGESLPDALSHIASNKLSPGGRAVKDLVTGKDWQGRPFEGTGQRLKAAAVDAAPFPIPLSPFVEKDAKAPLGYGLNHQPGAVEKQLFASAGLKLENAPSARTQVRSLAQRYRPPGASMPPGAYAPLKRALDNGDAGQAKTEVQALLDAGKPLEHIGIVLGIKKDGSVRPEVFTGSAEREEAMKRDFTPKQRELYAKAQAEHVAIARLFQEVAAGMKDAPAPAPRARALAAVAMKRGNPGLARSMVRNGAVPAEDLKAKKELAGSFAGF